MQQMNMVENEISFCGMQSSCHGHEPQKEIIEGTFEIDESPWMSFCAAGTSLYVRIYSSEKEDSSNNKGLASKKTDLNNAKVVARKKVPIMEKKILSTEIIKFKLKFEVEQGFGSPGAFIIENKDKHEFFLKSAILKYITSATENKDNLFHFYCNSWVYPLHKGAAKGIFFVNKLFLPEKTPPGLKELRKKELLKLRGGFKGERKPWDRIYEYDFYNDLGDPDNGRQFARPVLGGSTQFPYPRRLRTGRPPCQDEHFTESRPTTGCFQTYVPPDEQMSKEKQEELRNNFVDALVRFLSLRSDKPQRTSPYLVKKIVHFFVPEAALPIGEFGMIQSMVDFFKRKLKLSSSSSSNQNSGNPNLVDNMLDMFSDKEIKAIEEYAKKRLKKLLPDDIFNQVVANATEGKIVNSQLPSIIAENKFAWVEGKEFGRQMLVGTNPVRIQLLKEFRSGPNWPEEVKTDIEKAIGEQKAFILEHNDYLLPFLDMINGKGVCAYATRTILLQSKLDNTIEPKAIELSLPDPKSSMVIVPGEDGSNYRWELAMTHVAANDVAHHQLVSHWLHTHAVVEPFIIATRRQLSIMHPIHRLLDPHFKDTLHINALARRIFLNAGGILETLLFTGETSMLLSSKCYKKWRFDKQALPQDLVERGMAVKAEENMIKEPAEKEPKNEFPTGVKLILEDYPYAKDGLEIWHAITTWANAYCQHFYNSDDSVKEDVEIQAWWKEIREEGHGDQKEGWYELTTREDLVKALTTLIWITSGLHAAVNFGQYAYTAWPPNRPMLLRKFIPRQDQKEELEELNRDPNKFFMEMLPDKFDMALVMAITDTLSRHTSNEVYLGQMPPENGEEYFGQTPQEKELKDNDLNKKYKNFREKLEKIEKNIMERNKTYRLMNRWRYAKIPYKLLYPDTTKTKPTSSDREDIIGRGVPNSISI